MKKLWVTLMVVAVVVCGAGNPAAAQEAADTHAKAAENI
jgi:hypothetical protein